MCCAATCPWSAPAPGTPVLRVCKLAEHLPLYHERHMVKAGLTGWAQINYPYGASIEDARAKLSYDLYYVKNFSILFDLLIILQTLRVCTLAERGKVRKRAPPRSTNLV